MKVKPSKLQSQTIKLYILVYTLVYWYIYIYIYFFYSHTRNGRWLLFTYTCAECVQLFYTDIRDLLFNAGFEPLVGQVQAIIYLVVCHCIPSEGGCKYLIAETPSRAQRSNTLTTDLQQPPIYIYINLFSNLSSYLQINSIYKLFIINQSRQF